MVQDYVMKTKGIRVVGNSLRLRLIIKNGNNDPAKEDPGALADIWQTISIQMLSTG